MEMTQIMSLFYTGMKGLRSSQIIIPQRENSSSGFHHKLFVLFRIMSFDFFTKIGIYQKDMGRLYILLNINRYEVCHNLLLIFFC